jgi:hypothetical protein
MRLTCFGLVTIAKVSVNALFRRFGCAARCGHRNAFADCSA